VAEDAIANKIHEEPEFHGGFHQPLRKEIESFQK
jgi:hypothetical protein